MKARQTEHAKSPHRFELERRQTFARHILLHVGIPDQLRLALPREVGQHESHARLVELAPSVLGACEGLVDEGLMGVERALEGAGDVEVAGIDPHGEDDRLCVEHDDHLVPELESPGPQDTLTLVELRVVRVAAEDVGWRTPGESVAPGRLSVLGRGLEVRIEIAVRRPDPPNEDVEGVQGETPTDSPKGVAQRKPPRGARRRCHGSVAPHSLAPPPAVVTGEPRLGSNFAVERGGESVPEVELGCAADGGDPADRHGIERDPGEVDELIQSEDRGIIGEHDGGGRSAQSGSVE